MSLCPVPYVLAGYWLIKNVPIWASHRKGRLILSAVVCGATGVIYIFFSRRRLQLEKYRRGKLPVGLDRLRFNLSDDGFVPHCSEVLDRLPARFEVWELAADKLPELRSRALLRILMNRWPRLDFSSLERGDDKLMRRAYVVLSMIAHVYVWCDNPLVDKESPCTTLPAALAVPLYAAASSLGLPPVLTHAAIDLWNWRAVTNGRPLAVSQESFSSITTMTGTTDEAWCCSTSTAVQKLAGPSVVRAYDVLSEGVVSLDCTAISGFLDELALNLGAMTKTLSRLSERCSVDVHTGTLGPLLQGFGQDCEGLIYDGVKGYGGRPQRFIGANDAQATAIPVFDAVLGISHGRAGREFMKEMQKYMPKRHREYLELLQEQPPLRHVLMRWRDRCSNGDRSRTSLDISVNEVSGLISKFNVCVELLADFRRAMLASNEFRTGSKAHSSVSGGSPTTESGLVGSQLHLFFHSSISATLEARL